MTKVLQVHHGNRAVVRLIHHSRGTTPFAVVLDLDGIASFTPYAGYTDAIVAYTATAYMIDEKRPLSGKEVA